MHKIRVFPIEKLIRAGLPWTLVYCIKYLSPIVNFWRACPKSPSRGAARPIMIQCCCQKGLLPLLGQHSNSYIKVQAVVGTRLLLPFPPRNLLQPQLVSKKKDTKHLAKKFFGKSIGTVCCF